MKLRADYPVSEAGIGLSSPAANQGKTPTPNLTGNPGLMDWISFTPIHTPATPQTPVQGYGL